MAHRLRRRTVAMAAAGLATAAAPFVVAGPVSAGEAMTDGALTFVTNSGATVTCQVHASGNHDSGAGSLIAGTLASGGAPCAGNVLTSANYRNEDGDGRRGYAFGLGTFYAELFLSEGVASNIQISHRVQFTQCDPSRSAICEITLATSPK